MLFNSYIYVLAFLPVVAATYYLAGAHLHRQLSIAWLVIASLFFYGWWNPAYLPLIIGSALLNFFAGAAIRRSRTDKSFHALPLMILGVAANLGLLGYFKYFNFFIDNVNALFGVQIEVAPIFLPLAISFFTFQQISYLVDAYSRGTRDYNFIHYMLFVTFFPQLIAGPIVHHADMMSQFDRDETYAPRRRNIEIGLSIFAIGLFKKVILADTIAQFSTPVFDATDAGTSLSLYESWLGATAFGLQIYFDFSGYSDMAIGSARLFGIKLPINFYSPYKSMNISEFWRRWHMTLTQFITAYVYTPLSIARTRSALAADASEGVIFWQAVAWPAMVTFILAGLWHGAGWNFIIFGALQGVMMIINNLWRSFRKGRLKHKLSETTRTGRIAARLLTSVCFIFTLIFFKSASTAGAFTMAESMLGLNGLSAATSIISDQEFLFYAAVYFSIIFLLPNTQQLFIDYEPSLESPRKEQLRGIEKLKWTPNRYWAAACALMFGLALLNMNRASEFIYFQF